MNENYTQLILMLLTACCAVALLCYFLFAGVTHCIFTAIPVTIFAVILYDDRDVKRRLKHIVKRIKKSLL